MTAGTYRVVFINIVTKQSFARNVWAMDLDNLYEIIESQPQLKLAPGPASITRID